MCHRIDSFCSRLAPPVGVTVTRARSRSGQAATSLRRSDAVWLRYRATVTQLTVGPSSVPTLIGVTVTLFGIAVDLGGEMLGQCGPKIGIYTTKVK